MAVRKDKKTGGHICHCCAAMRAKPNRETIPECPECKRKNAPFEKDLRRVNKALKEEIDLENRIRQFLRDKRYALSGVPYKIVRQFIIYECGGGPGLVWDREREGEERKTARGS